MLGGIRSWLEPGRQHRLKYSPVQIAPPLCQHAVAGVGAGDLVHVLGELALGAQNVQVHPHDRLMRVEFAGPGPAGVQSSEDLRDERAADQWAECLVEEPGVNDGRAWHPEVIEHPGKKPRVYSEKLFASTAKKPVIMDQNSPPCMLCLSGIAVSHGASRGKTEKKLSQPVPHDQ